MAWIPGVNRLVVGNRSPAMTLSLSREIQTTTRELREQFNNKLVEPRRLGNIFTPSMRLRGNVSKSLNTMRNLAPKMDNKRRLQIVEE